MCPNLDPDRHPESWARTTLRTVAAFTVAALVGLGCSELGLSSPPPQAEVEAALQQLAETEKREAEADVNPNLGVKITWTIQSVTVRAQPENKERPYAGTIVFVVESKTPELDGYATERFDQTYEYLWDMETGAWQLQ